MKKSNAVSEGEIKHLLIELMNEYEDWEEAQGLIFSERGLLTHRYATHLQIAGAIVFGMLSGGIVMIAVFLVIVIFL